MRRCRHFETTSRTWTPASPVLAHASELLKSASIGTPRHPALHTSTEYGVFVRSFTRHAHCCMFLSRPAEQNADSPRSLVSRDETFRLLPFYGFFSKSLLRTRQQESPHQSTYMHALYLHPLDASRRILMHLRNTLWLLGTVVAPLLRNSDPLVWNETP